MSWLGAKSWTAQNRGENELEQSVADWTARQELANWIPSAIVLGLLLAGILLFAMSRLA